MSDAPNPASGSQLSDAIGAALRELERDESLRDPETLALGVGHFEGVLRRSLLPAVGSNGLLAGLLLAASAAPIIQLGVPDYWRWTLMAVMALALLALLWLMRQHASADLAIGISVSALFISATALLGSSLQVVSALVIAGIAATLIIRGALRTWGGLLVACYYPIVAAVFFQGDRWQARFLVEAVGLLALFFAFLSRGLRRVALAVVIISVLTGVLEFTAAENNPQAVSLLLFLFAGIAAVYEIRIHSLGQSSLRAFAGEGFLVLLIWLVVSGLSTDNVLSTRVAALSVAVAQGLLILRDRSTAPTRLAWIACAAAVAAWNGMPELSTEQRALIVLSLGLLLHIVGLALDHRFPSDVGIALLLVVAAWVGNQASVSDPSVATSLLGALASASVISTASRKALASGPPWWQGFAKTEHLAAIGRAGLIVVRPLLRMPLVAALLSGLRTGYGWILYIKGQEPLQATDFVLLTGHFFGASILSAQVKGLTGALLPVDGLDSAVAGLVWLLWGTSLLRSGVRHGARLLRFAGLATIAVPVVGWVSDIVMYGPTFFPSLAISVAGFALWVGKSSLRARDDMSPVGAS